MLDSDKEDRSFEKLQRIECSNRSSTRAENDPKDRFWEFDDRPPLAKVKRRLN